jgi:hypothetical protein
MMWPKTTCSIRARGGPRSPAALVPLALALVLCVQPARAASDEDTADGWKKVIAYARCALNVFRAVTPTDWTVAFLDCGRLYLEEPTLPGGQP